MEKQKMRKKRYYLVPERELNQINTYMEQNELVGLKDHEYQPLSQKIPSEILPPKVLTLGKHEHTGRSQKTHTLRMHEHTGKSQKTHTLRPKRTGWPGQRGRGTLRSHDLRERTQGAKKRSRRTQKLST